MSHGTELVQVRTAGLLVLVPVALAALLLTLTIPRGSGK